MRLLTIGDPHGEIAALPELERLIDYACDIGQKESIDTYVLMGDLFHNHAIIHLPVMEFWLKAFKKLSSRGKILALVGNHDKPGNINATANSLMIFPPNLVQVIDKDFYLNGVLWVGYQSNSDDFVELCNKHPEAKYVYCHQTFDGSRYENGFYAHDGINADLVPQKIISGHIHSPQEFGKVWYIGAPRWRIVTDANIERNIWVIEHENSTGELLSKKAYPTSGVCTPIYNVIDSPETPFEAPQEWLTTKPSVTVDVHGPIDYVTKRIPHFEILGYRVRPFPIKKYKSEVRESEGISNAFAKFAGSYRPKLGTVSNDLLKLAQERISWMKQ